jgi:hypothetical protein
MPVNKAFKKEKWLDAKYKPSGNQYNRSRRKDPALKCINTGKVIFCDNKKAGAKKSKAKAPAKKSAKETVMSRAKAPARRPKTMKRAFKPKPKPKPRNNAMAKAYMSQVGQFLFKKKEPKKSAKEAVMSRAKAPARRPKTMKRAFKPKPKPKPRSNEMANAYMSQVGQFLFKRDKEKMSSSDYKKYINKKVKDMSVEEKRQYGKLRTRESRARAKARKAQK